MDRQMRRSVRTFVSHWIERELQTRVAEALKAVSKVEVSYAASSDPALQSRLDQLRQDLIAIQRGSTRPRAGMVRWITDWIPDVDDPLVAATAAIERLAAPV
jgi:hypothetical protein